MKQVFSLLSQRRSFLEGHRFFELFRSDRVELGERFLFAPVLLDFVMGFADANKWFLSYSEPNGPLERGINEHTEEDRKHSRLFIDNWHELGLDAALGWSPGRTLWWLYQSQETAVVRRFGMEILKLAVRFPDVHVRFALMEAIEVCGAVFFSHTAEVAAALSEQTRVEYVYFGHHHLARETGHLHTNEALFFERALSPEQRQIIEGVVNRVFDDFGLVLDQLAVYYERLARGPSALEADLVRAHAEMLRAPTAKRAGLTATKQLDVPVSASQFPIFAALAERKARLEASPFFDWLANDRQVDPREKLQRFVALWGIDIAGYKDFCDFVLTYPDARSIEEHAINGWARDLASHGVLYLQDWQALGLDEVLGWATSDTIAFYFLSEATELHRKNLARITRHAIRGDRPIVRYWLITAFEAGGDALFGRTAPIAKAIERERGVELNYWAHRHHLAHPSPQEASVEAARFPQREMTIEEHATAIEIIHDVFDGFEAQFDLSYRLARARTLIAAPDSLVPVIRSRPTALLSAE